MKLKNMIKKLGLFIGRMNPPHKGHIAVIEKALSENDEVLILLGSNGCVNENNPLTFEQRKKILQKYFSKNQTTPSFSIREGCPEDRMGSECFPHLEINIIKDTQTNQEWVQNISDSIQKYGNIKLNIYGGDFKNDSAILAIKKYESLLSEDISYIPVDRFLETINYNGEDFHVSATNLRKALRNGDKQFVEKFCNEELLQDIMKYFTQK
ncbi:MAG: adenylyltransferase/cytidyltransferase family protein [Candidatus Gracilibacteria bacterium]|nr:adenylyltransferase/cytidyltransferase family protein [Candidatus Gracilibacteria bacterium]